MIDSIGIWDLLNCLFLGFGWSWLPRCLVRRLRGFEVEGPSVSCVNQGLLIAALLMLATLLSRLELLSRAIKGQS